MRPVDTHCHLDFDQYDDDRDAVLERCTEEMAAVVNVGTNPERNRASLDLAAAWDMVHPTVGLHPTYIDDLDQETVEQVAGQAREHAGAIRAVGEIGLDYHHVSDEDLRERQADLFQELLDVATELELPVVLHSRDAEDHVMDIVDGYEAGDVVLHCFNGRPALAEEAVDRGYWVSLSTQVLYSSRVQELAGTVPLDRLLLETDAPFLYRGERNVPWHVAESAAAIADIKDLEPEAVVTSTTRNAADVLDLPV